MFVSSKAIQNWTSPRWRISSSRRERAKGLMAEEQMKHVKGYLNRKKSLIKPIKTIHRSLGKLYLTEVGIHSSLFGNHYFQTPLSEINVEKVSRGEAEAYTQWLKSYSRGFRDLGPIGIQIAVADNQFSIDTMIMPVNIESKYARYSVISKGAELSKDPLPLEKDSIASVSFAFNNKSSYLGYADRFFEKKGITLSSWLGQRLDCFLGDLDIHPGSRGRNSRLGFFEIFKKAGKIPAGCRIEIANKKNFEEFLELLTQKIEEGINKRKNRRNRHYSIEKIKNNGTPYFLVRIGRKFPDVFAFKHKKFFYLVFERELMKKIRDGKSEQNQSFEWAGYNVSVKMKQSFINLWSVLSNKIHATDLQKKCWSHIPILNLLRKKFPRDNPVQVYEKLWHRKIQCIGDGEFEWNDYLDSMSSSVFGHPLMPKDPDELPAVLGGIDEFNVALKFIRNGGVHASMRFGMDSIE